MKGDSGLPPKQRLFCQEYLVDLNATAAYLRAGYKASEESARRLGSLLLTNLAIQREIDRLVKLRSARTEITQDRIVRELMALALVDPLDLFEPDGSLKRITEMPEAARRSIVGMEVAELFAGEGEKKHAFGLLKKIKLASKQGPLELLGKHVGMWPAKVTLDVGATLEALILQGMHQKAANE